MDSNQSNETNTILRLRDQQGLETIHANIETSISNIYESRKVLVSDFRRELFAQKVSNEAFANWNMDESGKLVIKTPPTNNQQGNTPFGNIQTDSSYDYKEYNSTIRYAYKKAISNLQNAKKSVELALKFNGEVDIPSNVLNNIDFFGDDVDNKRKVSEWGQRQINNFFKKRQNNRKW